MSVGIDLTGRFPLNRFADQSCAGTFEALCRQNVVGETNIPDAIYLTLTVFAIVATILILLLATAGGLLIRRKAELRGME